MNLRLRHHVFAPVTRGGPSYNPHELALAPGTRLGPYEITALLGAVGMLILPAKRRRARGELEARIADLRQRLTTALRSEFVAARDRSVHRLTDSIGPYSRFVRAAQAKWTDARTSLERWRTRMKPLAEGVG